jgi:hypothetical protein
VRLEDLCADPVLVGHDAEDEMLGPDLVSMQAQCFAECVLECLLDFWREGKLLGDLSAGASCDALDVGARGFQ